MQKKIKIDHIAKIEGHAGFVANIINGDIKSARIEILEGARLIEGLLIGRKYDEAPIITSRICGICPIVHNICSIKAMENALTVKESQQTALLRELLLYGQILQSHSLHLFLLCQDHEILALRDWINTYLAILGGRSIHPLTTMIGGFRKMPDAQKLAKLFENYFDVLKIALSLPLRFQKQPEFFRKTEFKALDRIYNGKIQELPEETQAGVVNRAKNIFMLGALARLHIYNYKDNNLKLPCYNTFYNLYAQVIEIVYYLEKIKELTPKKFKEKNIKYKIKAGKGIAGCEAPRGTLYHSYEIDKKGFIVKAKIVTPTAQFLNNLEADLKEYLKQDQSESGIKALIQAYDPCISCATH